MATFRARLDILGKQLAHSVLADASSSGDLVDEAECYLSGTSTGSSLDVTRLSEVEASTLFGLWAKIHGRPHSTIIYGAMTRPAPGEWPVDTTPARAPSPVDESADD